MYDLIFECEISIIDFASADDCLINYILLILKFVLINKYDSFRFFMLAIEYQHMFNLYLFMNQSDFW